MNIVAMPGFLSPLQTFSTRPADFVLYCIKTPAEVNVKQRRYKDEYRIVTDVDPRTGKPRETAVYAGSYYRFPEGSPAPRRRALGLMPWHALYWLCALGYLRTCHATGRCMYALMPFMLGLIPGLYGLMGLFSLYRAPARMTVVDRESGPGRLARSALGCAVLSGAGALGCAVFLSVAGLWASGWHEPALCAAAAFAAWKAFRVGKKNYGCLSAEAGE